MGAQTFAWINTSQDGPRGYSEEEKGVIRAQATRAAVTSRAARLTTAKEGGSPELCVARCSPPTGTGRKTTDEPPKPPYGASRLSSVRARDAWKTNPRPTTATTAPDATSTESQLITVAKPTRTEKRRSRAHPARAMPLTGFERLTADTGLDMLDLDELAGIVVGQVASFILSQDRESLPKLFSRRRHSYLFHMPARYGHNTCLDDALRCLAAGTRRLLLPAPARSDFQEKRVLRLYGKALNSLQAAVNEPDSWKNPHILGAIQVLGMYEVLDGPSRATAWENHISGAARFIRVRGPDGFKTDFEKELLHTMLGPIICEAMRLREPCFMEDEAWKPTVLSVVDPKAHHCSTRGMGTVSLHWISMKLSRLMLDMYDVGYHYETLPEQEVDDFVARCHSFKSDMMGWREEFDAAMAEPPSDQEPGPDPDYISEMLAAGLSMQAWASRFVSAVSPEERVSSEHEAVAYSREMREIFQRAGSRGRDMWTSFYIEQKILIADMIILSSAEWLSGTSTRRIIETSKLEAWASYLPADYAAYNPRVPLSLILSAGDGVATFSSSPSSGSESCLETDSEWQKDSPTPTP